jgi:ATPase subunit of ABC transporter with duplicated ATPase domains
MGNSIIAYVPAEIVAENIYDTDPTKIAECETEIQQERERKEEEERQAAAEREAARKLSDIELAIKQTKDTGTASLKVVGNKNAIESKLKKIRAAASANRIRVDVKPDGTVTLINM